MRARKRLITASLAVALVAVLPGTALADDAQTDEAVTDRVTDRPTDVVVDESSDQPTDRPTDRLTDRCIQRLTDRRCVDDKPSDRCRPHVTDRRCIDDKPTDRPIDRCLALAEHDRRCIDDHHPHDFNIRKLIWRLIHAHEWEKLIRLLHWLGWL